MLKFEAEPVGPSNAPTLTRVLEYDLDAELQSHNRLSPYIFPSQLAEAIHRLWQDRTVQDIVSSGDRICRQARPHHLSSFFVEALRIASDDYVPTETDILRCRQRSTGITETRFSVPPMSIHLFDVGGQRSERKKWIHCFESVTGIIFCAALSEYDQVLMETRNQNRMAESLILFDSVINSRWFLRTSIILFLNKVDIFQHKLRRVPLEQYFQEYTGGPNVDKATKYILWRFMQRNRAKLNVYPHITQATDTSSIRLVFGAVANTIVENLLENTGFL
jgi:guanine nucleotide-binding protein G(i) subunit alpha